MRPLLPLLTLLALCGVGFAATAPIRVLVWDERQPEQKKAYDGGFLGEAIAKHLAGLPGLAVKSVSLDSPEQGLGEATLAETDVVIFWCHKRPLEQDDARTEALVRRVMAGKTGFVALHSAHWAKPFVRLMQERAKADALAVLEAAGAPVATLQVVAGAPSWFHPGRSGTIQMGPQNKLGFFGEIHPRVLAAMDVKGPLVAFELILNAIPGSKSKGATRAALVISDLMPLSRDFAFVVDDAIVVVENVERNISSGLAPRAATIRAMNEVSGAVIAVAMVLGSNGAVFFDPASFLLVLGGTLTAILARRSADDFVDHLRALRVIVQRNAFTLPPLAARLESWARTTRREGALALEPALDKENNPFLRHALMLLIDGANELGVISPINSKDSRGVHKSNGPVQTVFSTLRNLVNVDRIIMGANSQEILVW